MNHVLAQVLDMSQHPIEDDAFKQQCQQTLAHDGVLLLKNLLTQSALDSIRRDGEQNAHNAFYTQSSHNVYLAPSSSAHSETHPRNRSVTSSKGCITTDQIPADSVLHTLYNNTTFRSFLSAVLNENELHEYADPLSSINLHYAAEDQELGWHFDNSSFAITLLIEKPEDGGVFEYVKNARDADANDMNYELVGKILDGQTAISQLDINPGDLVLFRGRNSMHRVTPTIGETTRMLVVLAYNTEAGVSLSESARQTFYGRLS